MLIHLLTNEIQNNGMRPSNMLSKHCQSFQSYFFQVNSNKEQRNKIRAMHSSQFFFL